MPDAADPASQPPARPADSADSADPAPRPPEEPRIVAIRDERDALADGALALIDEMFAPRDRHPLDELRSELAERRLGMFTTYNFHLLAAMLGEEPLPAGTICGVYLGGVNAGFVMYLAVRKEHRGRRIARVLRPALIDAFRADARRGGHADLAWVLGEVRRTSPWLRRLVRTRGAIPFDLDYFHPGMSPGSAEPYVLYRQPVADRRRELPVVEARRILYAIYRRAYRVRYPLQRESFAAMIGQLEGRTTVGVHPAFASLLPDE